MTWVNTVTDIPQPLISLKFTDPYGYGTVDADINGKVTYQDYTITAASPGLLKFFVYSDYDRCSSYIPYYFLIKNQLARIAVEGKEELKYEDLDFNSRIIDIDKHFDVTLKFYNSLGDPYADHEVYVDLAPIQIPPSSFYNMNLYSDAIYALKENYYTLEHLSEKTDRLGRLTIRIRIKVREYGFWGITFTSGCAVSLPYLFKTTMPVAAVRVIQQFAYIPNENDPPEPGTGDVLTVTPRVQVVDAENKTMEGVTVLALIDEGSGCNNGTPTVMMDEYSFGCTNHNNRGIYVTRQWYYNQKFDITNHLGEADFRYFTIMDSISYACVRFIFVVGEPGLMVKSEPTQTICFRNYYEYSLEPGTSLSVTSNKYFGNMPVVTIKRRNWVFNDDTTIYVTAMIRYMDGARKLDRRVITPQVLNYYTCLFWGKTNGDGNCEDLKVIQNGPPATMQATFGWLVWTKPTLYSTFQLEFSSILKEEGAALSPTIEVTSSPINLAVFFVIQIIIVYLTATKRNNDWKSFQNSNASFDWGW